MSARRAVRRRSGARGERGLALVLVVVVLAALAGILAPFLLSMRLEERSADGFQAARRAEMAARAAVELGVLQAMRTHPSRERDRAKDRRQLAASPEDWDDLSELLPRFGDLPGAEPFRVRDPRGTILDARVEDEQGKLDLRTAPAHVISNLLGVTVLLEDVTADSEELVVEDARAFFTDHDPETIDGLLWVGGLELIAYRDIVEEPLPEADLAAGAAAGAEAGSADDASDGSAVATGTPDELVTLGVRYRVRGLVRGAYLSAPTARYLEHVSGSFVRDARGIKVALHPFWKEIGRFHPFRTVAEVRDIASWSILDVYLAGLFRRGYTAEDLQALGLGGEALGEAGAARTLEREGELEAARKKAEAEAAASAEGEAPKAEPELPKGKRLSPTRAGSFLDGAVRRHGRQGGEAWLQKAFGAADLSDPKAKAFVEATRSLLEQRAAYERKAFREGGAALGSLSAVRDLEVLGAREYARIRPYLTVHAVRAAEWSGGALVLNRLEPDPTETTSALVIGVEIPGCRGGTVARIEAGQKVEVRRVVGYRRPSGGRPGVVRVWPQLSGTYDAESARVFAAQAHPVNVNTAPRAVLRAVLIGLSGGRGESVTPREAEALVARLVEAAPIDGPDAFQQLIVQAATDGVISGADARAVVGNALDEEARVGARTLPFCFRSGGTFTVEGTGIVNDPAGNELARRVIREVVAVAPPDIVTLHLDSQRDFFGGFRDPQSDRLRWRPGDRRANLLETDPVPLRQTRMAQWPSGSHEPGIGKMRLATGEVAGPVGKDGVLKLEHYRESWDGKRIEGGGLSLGAPPRQKDPYGTWPEEVLAPGFLELWLKVDDPGRSFTVFDLGQRERTDRLVLTYDGTAQELRFRAYDAAIEARDAAHVRALVPLKADVWYHVAASWRGSRPGDLALFVDGLPAGIDVGLSHLQSAIDENATTLTVQNAAAIPVPGPVRVGREVMDVVARRGNQLVVRTAPGTAAGSPPVIPIGRGARGTTAAEHEVGTQVMPWGYTGFFVATIPGLPFDLAKIHRGGSALTYPLPPETPLALLMPPGGPATGLVFEDETSLPVVPQGRTLQQRGFPPRGFLQVHHELVYYDRLEAHAFSDCVRKVYGWFQDDQQALVPPPVPPNPKAGYRAYTPIVLASIEVQDASDYENLDALPQGVGLDALRGFWAAIDGPAPQQKEWIRYARAHQLPNPQTGQPDPRWQNLLLLCDTELGFGTQPRTGGRTNAVSTNDRQWPRADGFQADGVAKYQALLLQLQQDAGGPIPGLFMPGHIHIGMEWGRGLFRTDPPTSRPNHPAGAVVIPAHAVTRPYAGAGDMVTLLDSQPLTPFRQELRVWDAVSSLRLLLPTGRARRLPFYLVAFEGFLPNRPYEAAKGARLVKRPSGELPLVAPAEMRFGATYAGGEEPAAPGGTFTGWIDELKLSRDETNAGMTHPAEGRASTGRRVVPEPMPPISQLGTVFHQARRGIVPLARRLEAGDANALLTANWARLGRGVNRTGVLLRLDEEVIGASRFENRTFVQLARGMLRTKPQAHSVESPVYVLPFPPAVRLRGPVEGRGQLRYTGVHPSLAALPRRGVLMIDALQGGGVRELLTYEPGRRRSVRLPLDDRQRVAYRGAFGTTPNAPLGEGTLAIAFPFRFFDRYKVGVDSDEGAFYEARFTPAGQDGARVARFLELEWDERPVNADVDVVVLARVDGHPAWTAQPTNKPGGLYRFDDPAHQNRIGVTGRTIEVRCVFPFRGGAYSRGGWKASPTVDAIRVRYARPVTVLEVQDATPSG